MKLVITAFANVVVRLPARGRSVGQFATLPAIFANVRTVLIFAHTTKSALPELVVGKFTVIDIRCW